MPIIPALEKSPRHARLIGLMVVGYGELELTFCNCAGLVIGEQFKVLEEVHTVRPASQRIAIAHKMSCEAYASVGLKSEYAEVLSALKHCLDVRNEYAHSHYDRIGNQLRRFSPEGGAFRNLVQPFPWKRVSLALLREQAALFEWTRGMLIWIELSIPRLLEKKPTPLPRPKPISLPAHVA